MLEKEKKIPAIAIPIRCGISPKAIFSLLQRLPEVIFLFYQKIYD